MAMTIATTVLVLLVDARLVDDDVALAEAVCKTKLGSGRGCRGRGKDGPGRTSHNNDLSAASAAGLGLVGGQQSTRRG